ncbi:MAG: hypothetical protein AB8H79_07935 [Myxococcota bacterium]
MYRLTLAFSLTLIGCGVDTPNEPLVLTAPAPTADMQATARLDLRPALSDEAAPVGISIAPDTGELLVIDAWQGVFRQVDGEFSLAVTPEALTPVEMWDMRPYTDVAALPNGQLAITVRSDGLLYRPDEGVTRQHFCYEPDDGGDWTEQYQLTDSLTYEPTNGRLYATPQTFEGDTPLDAFAAQFDAAGGSPLGFDALDDPRYRFGAVVAVAPNELVVAQGSVLLDYTAGEGLSPRVDLASFGIRDVQGMTLDPATGNLLVLDGAGLEIVTFTHW